MNAIKNLKTKFSCETGSVNRNVTFVDEPLDNDVLLGKSKIAYNHKGNHRFRCFIWEHLQQYINATSKSEKTWLDIEVVEAITKAGGRFLEHYSKTDKWVIVSPQTAKKKVGHAFRDAVKRTLRGRMPSIGKDEGIMGHDGTFRKNNIGALAKAKRNSVTKSRRVSQISPNDLARISRSCNDLENNNDAAMRNSMILNAQRVYLERGKNSDDSNELSECQRADLLFDHQSHLDLHHIPVSTPTRRTEPMLARVKKLTYYSYSWKRATRKELPRDTNMASHLPADIEVFDDRSDELSVLSEGTSKKWSDPGSGEFSINTHVFDHYDEDRTKHAVLPQDLIEKVNKEVTNLEVSGKPMSLCLKAKEVTCLLERKISNKTVHNIELSEEFSVMSLNMQDIPDPTPIHQKEFISARVKNLTDWFVNKKRTTQKEFPCDTNMASPLAADAEVFDDRLDELSDTSEGTSKKWSDPGSGEFSIDTHVFDHHNSDRANHAFLPQDLIEKVNKEVTNLEVSGKPMSLCSKAKEVTCFLERKISNKTVHNIELSEEFSVMSLNMQDIPDPTPMHRTGFILARVKNLTDWCVNKKRTTQKEFPCDTNMASPLAADAEVFDDRLDELSVTSEGTSKMWSDPGSGEFSIT